MSRRRSAFFAPLVLSLVLLIAACGGGVFAPGQADRGIGGTGIGIADRGIGGTGIVGTVTAFGSIWINGLRVELPTSAQVRIEGQSASVDDVRIGQVIAVTAAAGGPTGLSARVLDVRYAVAGPVERVAGGVAVVLGQKIETESALGRDALAPGAWVAVSGLRRADGVIVAGRIDFWAANRGWLLRGRLEAVTDATIRVAGTVVSRAGLTKADLDAVLASDARNLRIAGRVVGQATSVNADPINPFGAGVGALSIETFTDASGGLAGGASDDQVGASGSLAANSRVVIDSLVDRGGGVGASRAFGAPGLGATAAPGGDPAARAAGLARSRDGAPGGVGFGSGFGPGLGPSFGPSLGTDPGMGRSARDGVESDAVADPARATAPTGLPDGSPLGGARGAGIGTGSGAAPAGSSPGSSGGPPGGGLGGLGGFGGVGPPGAPGNGPPGSGPPGAGGFGRSSPGFGGDVGGGRSAGGSPGRGGPNGRSAR